MNHPVGRSIHGAVLFCVGLALAADPPLTNEDIIQMTRAGLPRAAIAKLVETRPAAFDTSVSALIKLKNEGVAEDVITALVSRVHTTAAPRALTEVPDEPGVYARVTDRRGERVVPLHVEIVTWREGGAVKSIPTRIVGIGPRGHFNGSVAGPASVTRLSPPFEILVRCSPGTTVEEYQLLRLWEKSNRREFRMVTGGVIHSSGGADLNVMKFEAEKLGPGSYRIVIKDLPQGEFGVLPPSAALSASAASRGKIYTFGTE
jgi:hypothetical protein